MTVEKENIADSVTLVVDVGNTHTVLGIFKGTKVVDYWRLTTRKETTSDEVMNKVGGLLGFSKIKPSEIAHVGLSTVVPALERPWIKALDSLLKKHVQVVNAKNCLGLKIDYQNPSMAGADRLCNVIAMREEGFKNSIIVDMGTATTFDVLKDGAFAGGVIIPGINASLDALTEKAARLLPVTIEWPENVVADNTDDAIRAGLLFGFLAQLEFLIGKIKKEVGCEDLPVYATGGWGKMIARRTTLIDKYDPFLTLRGIRLVAVNGNVAASADETRDSEEE
ncbi:MAG: type III pantothenate kinase [Fibrobacter sp.]|nr:type III pantothenate kinase [Fibrobacter sp.]